MNEGRRQAQAKKPCPPPIVRLPPSAGGRESSRDPKREPFDLGFRHRTRDREVRDEDPSPAPSHAQMIARVMRRYEYIMNNREGSRRIGLDSQAPGNPESAVWCDL